jgi:beta-N-acetylhexosaminidase
MVGECIDGLHSRGIRVSLKHYPGHGDTANDSHTGAVVTGRTWDELKARELIPFIDNLPKADMIMTAHIVSAGVTGGELPATLSPVMINEKLRGELGYDGVVITDSMEMGAISKEFSQEEAAVRAIEAGCDIILCPGDYNKEYDAIRDAVNSGRLTEERIDESLLRIIRMKLGIREE